MNIDELYKDKSLRQYAFKLTKDFHDAEELCSRVFEKLLKKGKFVNKRYVARVIHNQFISDQRKKKFKTEIIDDIAEAYHVQDHRFEQVLKQLDVYDRDLIECLIDGDSGRKINRETGISIPLILQDMERAKKRFMNLYKDIKIGILLPGEPDDTKTGKASTNQGVNAVKYHRLLAPLAHLTQTYNIEFKVLFNGKNDKWLMECYDVSHVICSRELSSFYVQQDKLCYDILRKRGIKVILDMDDYWVLPKHHILYSMYKREKLTERYINLIKNCCDAVWTTTKQLADKIRPLNKNVFIVKNALFDKQFVNSSTQIDFDTFYYSGGSTHKRDLSIIKGLMNDYKFKIMITDKEKYIDEWFPEAEMIPPKFVSSYAEEYHNAGIFLIPLIENDFNSCKSELKMIEAGHFGKPVIVSNVAPYTNLATSKNSLRVKNNPEEWSKAIKRMHGNHQMQFELGQQLQEDVIANYNIKEQNKIRLESL